LVVPTQPMLGTDTNRIVAWAGALIQMPYKAVLEQVSNVPSGVYVSCTLYGSPASTALRPGVWITEVDGIPVGNLDEFLDAVHNHENKVVRSRQGSVCEFALKRLSLAYGGNHGGNHGGNKRLSATVLQQQHLLAHPEAVPPQQHNCATHDCSTDAAPVAPTPGAAGGGEGAVKESTAAAASMDAPSTPQSPSIDQSDDAAQSQGYVRIKIQARNGNVSVIAMKLDPIYWGTTQLLPDPDSVSGWKMMDVI